MSHPPLPHNRDAEDSVVGGILFAGAKALVEVADLLEPGDFFSPLHEVIYAAIVELDKRDIGIDLVTVAEQMRQNGTLAQLAAYGCEAFLAELANKVATWEGIKHHAQIVRDKAMVRRMILAADWVRQRGYDAELDPAQYLDQAEQRIFEAASQHKVAPYSSLRAMLPKTLEELERRAKCTGGITGLSTGYHQLDRTLSGLQPGEMLLIAARPSLGKTALALCIGRNVAAPPESAATLVFSLEMSKQALIERLLAAEARVNSQAIRSGQMATPDWIRVMGASNGLAAIDLDIDDTSSPTIMQIRAKARRWRADRSRFPKDKPRRGLIVVDYLQLASGSGGKDGNREREIAEISRGLKALAKELGVPVVALSQLNREVENRDGHRPVLSDLRESGSLEQDADVVLFIYRDERYNPNSADAGIAELIVAKQRNGPTDTVKLVFLKEFTRFENLANRSDEPTAPYVGPA